MAATSAPIMSTPAEHILQEPVPLASAASTRHLSKEELYLQYEIERTVEEIRAECWKRIALQFPDDMLRDAPRVFEHLRHDLAAARDTAKREASKSLDVHVQLDDLQLDTSRPSSAVPDQNERLCILADTSYGACCVDEVAAEHVDADVVIHYGRACLSPTARIPVIYVFTSKALDLDVVVSSFTATYPDKSEKVCLVADIPYDHLLAQLSRILVDIGYEAVFRTDIVRDPSSLIPNRTLPVEAKDDPQALREYSVFHISAPPTSLLLILSSRIKNMRIFPTDVPARSPCLVAALEPSTAQLLRRRYALITSLSTVPVFGILINTLSVSDYMGALQRCQDVIARAGKKSYVFVVGKVNAAKVANFSEIGGWVVIGCWESSLIESKDFYRPMITPFELEAALTEDKDRVWGQEWIGDFGALLGRELQQGTDEADPRQLPSMADRDWDEQSSDDEPPEFDLRTGKYVSHTRPMERSKPARASHTNEEQAPSGTQPNSALVRRSNGDVATVGGQISPAAEYLRSKRTWQGLGSDHEVAYERDEHGRIRGAAMEEGRTGTARSYTTTLSENMT